jgi:hypothetical protein
MVFPILHKVIMDLRSLATNFESIWMELTSRKSHHFGHKRIPRQRVLWSHWWSYSVCQCERHSMEKASTELLLRFCSNWASFSSQIQTKLQVSQPQCVTIPSDMSARVIENDAKAKSENESTRWQKNTGVQNPNQWFSTCSSTETE